MATKGKSCRNYRPWKLTDSDEPSDVHRLYDPERLRTTKPGKWINYGTCFLLLIGVGTLFSFGVLVGFYVRESQKVSSCSQTHREDGLGSEKLMAVYNNVMYFMSGDNAIKYYRQLSESQLPVSDKNWDRAAAKLVETELRSFGLDQVEIEDHDVVVTYPDPQRPNRLEVIEGDKMTLNLTFQHKQDIQTIATQEQVKGGDNQLTELPPFVAFSPSGDVQGHLVYANYGRYVDFLQVKSYNTSTIGAVFLIQQGKISIAQKVRWAEKFGAVGVLLYCDLDHCSHDNQNGLYASAGDFASGKDSVYPTIPVQTVSMATAIKILQNYPEAYLPDVWKSFLQISMHLKLRNSGTDVARVRLIVHSKQQTQKIRNIFGTVFGSSESDHYVMIGAGRTKFPADDRDAGSNTALLLEMARSLSRVRQIEEEWKPRRTIKFCSWGGAELSNNGILQYIKIHRHVLQKNAVAYIEFDLRYTGSDVMQFSSSPSLIGLIRNAADRVPDPSDPDLSVAERWPKPTPTWYLSTTFPYRNYHSNRQVYPMIHQLGIPTIGVRFGETSNSYQMTADFDTQHHFKYHMAVARVISLALISIADNELLPFEIGFYTNLVNERLKDTVQIMSQIYVKVNSTDAMLSAAENLQEMGSRFNEHRKEIKTTHNALAIRKINDAMRRFDEIFVGTSLHQNVSEYLLCQDEEDGSLTSFTNVIDEVIVTGNRDSIHSLIQQLTSAVEQGSEILLSAMR